MALIDRDALMLDILNMKGNGTLVKKSDVISLVKGYSASYRQTAKWVKVRTMDKGVTVYMECSKCQMQASLKVYEKRYQYCPYCGTKMKVD